MASLPIVLSGGTWRKGVAGAALRKALAQSGIDSATVAMLRVSGEAALELGRDRGAPELLDTGAPVPAGGDRDEASAGPFEARIGRLMRRCRHGRGINLARASLAEALAWCPARPEASSPPPPQPSTARREGTGGGAV